MSTAPRLARGLAATYAMRWGFGPDTVDAVELIVSELVTNAVTHTRSAAVDVAVMQSGTAITVMVGDMGSAGKERLEAQDVVGFEEESGRGLSLVAGIASAWGSSRQGGVGLVVWAEVREPELQEA
ncbi:ATP-binding protein [Streptomyces sp. GbtcB6]|uniref:ATP-binding protein n=1 Tax=Streptomyces sp. GbtcB6 TaxID=2824751 RepID=UPI001C310A23|nr:ATP-binding protein [Streptomyces sp. GbtcB6]